MKYNLFIMLKFVITLHKIHLIKWKILDSVCIVDFSLKELGWFDINMSTSNILRLISWYTDRREVSISEAIKGDVFNGFDVCYSSYKSQTLIHAPLYFFLIYTFG